MSDTITLSREHAQALLEVLSRATELVSSDEQEAMLALIVELNPECVASALSESADATCRSCGREMPGPHADDCDPYDWSDA